MVWVSSQLIIGYYFEKYRPIANGLSCSGAGVGIMIFAYMNNMLVPALGWRNLMRLHVGFLVLVLLMGLTFVEVSPTKIGRIKEVIQTIMHYIYSFNIFNFLNKFADILG